MKENPHKILLVVDIDGTIADIPKEAFPFKVKDKSYCEGCRFYKNGGCTRTVWCENADSSTITQFYNSESVLKFPVYGNSLEVVNQIYSSEPSIVVYVSARGLELTTPTYAWLKENGFPSGKVFCVGNSDPADKKLDCVKNICYNVNPDQIITLEDDPIIRERYEQELGAKDLYSLINNA